MVLGRTLGSSLENGYPLAKAVKTANTKKTTQKRPLIRVAFHSIYGLKSLALRW